MKVNVLGKAEFLGLAEDGPRLLALINEPQAFVIQGFYPHEEIFALRSRCFDRNRDSEPAFHPLIEGCPDFHRLHDNYPNAYVKSKMHSFQHHGWKEENGALFHYFREIFALKNRLVGLPAETYVNAHPSEGCVARVSLHNYPRGGGYMAEHIDPLGVHARIQTIVQASEYGHDFDSGGLFARADPGAEKIYFDPISNPGDLLVLSPGIPHGVDPIDPEVEYDWRVNRGRWMVVPVFLNPDYPQFDNKSQTLS